MFFYLPLCRNQKKQDGTLRGEGGRVLEGGREGFGKGKGVGSVLG